MGKRGKHYPTRRKTLSVHHAERIKTGKLISRLQAHVLDDQPMDASQIKAAQILLGKVLPDLKAVEARLEDRRGADLNTYTQAELERIAAGQVIDLTGEVGRLPAPAIAAPDPVPGVDPVGGFASESVDAPRKKKIIEEGLT